MKDLWELLGVNHFDALERTKGLSPTPANLDRAAKEFGIEATRWAFEQWDLRRRARAKFERSEEMLFDREALEMATHERVAQMHAAPFPPRARVADLTVGIGADLIALARENEALGYEVSPIRAAMARHNLRVHGFEAEIRVGDCLASSWDFEYAFADPARRSGGRRVVRAEDYQPPLPELADRMSVLALGLIKVSPMLRDEELRAYGSRVDFWSFGGECREAVLQVGRGIEDDDSIRAFHVESGSRLGGREVELLGVGHEPLEEPLEYVFEADPAAIRAHALPRLCKLLAARPLGDSSGYLTSAETAQDREGMAFSRAFRAVSYGRADLKRIREELTSRDATVEAVKIRGVREDPEVWRRGLRASGTVKLFLLLYPVGKSVRYVLAEPS